uniref:Uncharacterized protein n=1 Tax=Glossina pallidipes TaxID=7398 RepID=A0A1A9ZMH9_GLOPL
MKKQMMDSAKYEPKSYYKVKNMDFNKIKEQNDIFNNRITELYKQLYVHIHYAAIINLAKLLVKASYDQFFKVSLSAVIYMVLATASTWTICVPQVDSLVAGTGIDMPK